MRDGSRPRGNPASGHRVKPATTRPQFVLRSLEVSSVDTVRTLTCHSKKKVIHTCTRLGGWGALWRTCKLSVSDGNVASWPSSVGFLVLLIRSLSNLQRPSEVLDKSVRTVFHHTTALAWRRRLFPNVFVQDFQTSLYLIVHNGGLLLFEGLVGLWRP